MIVASRYTASCTVALAFMVWVQAAGMSIPIAGELYTYLKNHKAPLNIVGVNGLMPNNYCIVYTTITIKPDDYVYASKKLGPSPLITRAQIGSVGPSNTACQFQAQLDVPDTPIDLLSSAQNIPELVTKIAGAVNPVAGAVSGAVSAILDIGLQMASDQINKTLGIQETTLGLIEILPAKYYRINSDTNEIELTADFKQDLVSYDALHTQAIPAVQAFNTANNQYGYQRMAYYNKYGTYELMDGDQQAEDDYNAILDQYNNQLVPSLKTAVGLLKQLEQYALHRISIMALNSKPGDSSIGGWKGPFRLNIFFFLGAKATNTFTIDFYVKDAGNIQNVSIKISPDILSTNPLRWNKGGIKLVAVDQNNQPCTQTCQLGFQALRAGQQIMAAESLLCSWWDSLIISDDGNATGLTQYLLPFDMYKLQKEIQAKNQAQASAVSKAAETAIGTLTQFFGKKEIQKQLLDPTQTASGSSLSASTGNMLSMLANLDLSINSTPTVPAQNPDASNPTGLDPHNIPDL